LKLKNNGTIIFQTAYYQQTDAAGLERKFIIPANTSIEITMTNHDSSSHDVGISAYGYYLEAM